jgi:DNA-binding CsgD family transcriptional regulator
MSEQDDESPEPGLRPLAPTPGPIVQLSPRQVECLRRIALGQTTAEIAIALGLSPHTVNHYVDSACDKLQAKTRAHAVATALERNLLGGPVLGPLGEF